MDQPRVMSREADADQQIARGALRQPDRTGVRRRDEGTERNAIRMGRIERQPLPMRRRKVVERAERQSRLRDNRHVVRFVSDDAIHPRERDSNCHRRRTHLRECARRSKRRKRDRIGLAFAHNLRNFIGVARLGDNRRSPRLMADRLPHMRVAHDCAKFAREFGRGLHRLRGVRARPAGAAS